MPRAQILGSLGQEIEEVRIYGGGAGGSSQVEGNLAGGAVDSGNPVKIGGLVNTTAPANLTTGKRADLWVGASGQIIIGAYGTAGSAGSDSRTTLSNVLLPNGDISLLQVANSLFNNATMDRARNNTEGILLASAARTTTVTSATQTNHNARGVMLVAYVTAKVGTTALNFYLGSVPPSGGAPFYSQLVPWTAAVGKTAVMLFYPGVISTDLVVGGSTTAVAGRSVAVPRSWVLQVSPGDADSVTYSVDYQYIL